MFVPITPAGARLVPEFRVLPSRAASQARGTPAGPSAEAALLHHKLFQPPCRQSFSRMQTDRIFGSLKKLSGVIILNSW